MRRAMTHISVTFDEGGYDPATDRYPITCPNCHYRTAFTIRGGRWPGSCPHCYRQWLFAGVTTPKVKATNAAYRARRRGVCPAREIVGERRAARARRAIEGAAPARAR